MRILMTGASSFTGSWFARRLAEAGHEVVTVFRSAQDTYSGGRAERVEHVWRATRPIWGSAFGDDDFLAVAGDGSYDLFCHHAAEMTGYRSWDFDTLGATAKNTHKLREVLTVLAENGCKRTVFTGSVFEPHEGVGDPEKRAFSPYGLSKHLTWEIARMEARPLGYRLGKFVIPNPFGPFEEPRFTSYLASEWMKGKTPTVGTPAYIRDNIHVSLLAETYLRFCEQLGDSQGVEVTRPSGYVESQGAFAFRCARELGPRLGLKCELGMVEQTRFEEPAFRVNTDVASVAIPQWSERAAWDDLATYYRAKFGT